MPEAGGRPGGPAAGSSSGLKQLFGADFAPGPAVLCGAFFIPGERPQHGVVPRRTGLGRLPFEQPVRNSWLANDPRGGPRHAVAGPNKAC
jgi:hypothetical protein